METLSFDNIAIIYNEDVKSSLEVAKSVEKQICAKGLNAQTVSSSLFDKNATFVVTVGGDGTLLRAARFYAPINVPIFGLNLGRLGFLAQANFDEVDFAFDKLLNGKYRVENRMMLSAVDKDILALNDIVIKGDSFSRTSKLFLSINGKVVSDYLADGIIISTPTGSTAYTLSAGGPVVSPDLEAIIIVPICPHTLTSRPLVIPACEQIEVSSCNTCNKLKMSADGQYTVDVNKSEQIFIKKSDIYAKLVILEDKGNEFYSVLRKKLQWGVAPEC